jgi:hypothetical protein
MLGQAKNAQAVGDGARSDRSAAAVLRLRWQKVARKGAIQVTKACGRCRSGRTIRDLLRRCGVCRPNGAACGKIVMSPTDPVIERIAAYPWPRGGVSVRKLRGGYSLSSARTGAPVARLKPMPTAGRFEVLWWRRDAWGPPGQFGAVFDLDDALDFIASSRPFGSAPNLTGP